VCVSVANTADTGLYLPRQVWRLVLRLGRSIPDWRSGDSSYRQSRK